MTHQINFVFKESDWKTPTSFPNLKDAKEIAIDLETKDPNMKTLGPGWPRFDGGIVGFAVAVAGQQYYFPIHHDAGGNMDLAVTTAWMVDLLKRPSTGIQTKTKSVLIDQSCSYHCIYNLSSNLKAVSF